MSQTIMLLEDDDAQRHTVQAQLESLGYTVIAVRNGMMALGAAESQTVHLLFTDLYLPGGPHGLSVANMIRYRRNIPTIFMTAFSELADTSTYPLPGRVFNKPIDLAEVAAEIERVLPPTAVGHDPTDRTRRWRMKAEELRTTAQVFKNAASRASMLRAAEGYDTLAEAEETRLQRRSDKEPEKG